MKVCLNSVIALLMSVGFMPLHAQTACDKLFANGIQCQQTLTVHSIKKAIECFEKAKICYDSQSKKNICDEQIKACNKLIYRLRKENEKITQQQENKENNTTDDVQTVSNTPVVFPQPIVKSEDVTLILDVYLLKFKGKGNEFKKVHVTCNYPDWKVENKPSWVNCSRNEENELVIEVLKNNTKEERQGSIKIECRGESANLIIVQGKFKKFVVF